MENRVTEYEAPVFEFEEMKLAEDVANKCWGFAYAWFDGNGDGDHNDENEVVKLSDIGLKDKGCQGNEAVTSLVDYFNGKFPDANLAYSDCSTNVKDGKIGGFGS